MIPASQKSAVLAILIAPVFNSFISAQTKLAMIHYDSEPQGFRANVSHDDLTTARKVRVLSTQKQSYIWQSPIYG